MSHTWYFDDSYSLSRISFISLMDMTEADVHNTSIAQEALNFLADLEHGNEPENRRVAKDRAPDRAGEDKLEAGYTEIEVEFTYENIL